MDSGRPVHSRCVPVEPAGWIAAPGYQRVVRRTRLQKPRGECDMGRIFVMLRCKKRLFL